MTDPTPEGQGEAPATQTDAGDTVASEPTPEQLQAREELREKVQRLLDEEINPGIAMHGGFIVLLDVDLENRLFVQLGGGCQGCGMVDVTLRQGVETLIRERYPEVKELIDTTDHASGMNPFFAPGKY